MQNDYYSLQDTGLPRLDGFGEDPKRRSALNQRNDRAGIVTDRIIQGGFLFLILVTPLLFGSVYPWAHALIQFVTALMFGAWLVRVLLIGRGTPAEVPNVRLFLPAILFFLVILFQLTPLPPRVLQGLSPKTASLYETFLTVEDPWTGAGQTPVPVGSEGIGMEGRGLAEAGSIPVLDPQKAKTQPLTLSLAPDRTRKQGILLLTYVALLFLFINYQPDGPLHVFLRRVITWMVASGILVASIGLVQKVMGVTRVYGFWQPLHEVRQPCMGPYINANHFAGYMELVIPLTLGLFLAWAAGIKRGLRPGNHRVVDTIQAPENSKILLGLLGIGVMVLTIFLSFSRAGIVSFMLTLLLLYVLMGHMEHRFRPGHWQAVRGRWRLFLLLVLLVLGVAGLIVFSLKVGGLAGLAENTRFPVWRDSLQILRDFPLFGVGLNGFSVIAAAYQSHRSALSYTHMENEYLQMIVETGLAGFILATLFLVFFLREVGIVFRWRARQFLETRKDGTQETTAPPEGRRTRYGAGPAPQPVYPLPRTNYFLFWGCAGSLICLGLHSLADFHFHIPANGLLFFLLLGLLFRLVRLQRPVFTFASRRVHSE